jgi:hypothetical protein
MDSSPAADSSLTDTSEYRRFCAAAAVDDAVFETFRRAPECTGIVETVPAKDGADYLAHVRRHAPSLLGHMPAFAASDAVGGPRRHWYRTGTLAVRRMAPTTLRYVKTAGDLQRLFGSLDTLRILEIGGGYGGLCKVISDVWRWRSYTIVDLVEPLALTRRFLHTLAIDDVELVDAMSITDAPHDDEYDLVISNYAYSEIRLDLQELYYRRFLERIPRGYMMWNVQPHPWDTEQLEAGEFAARFGGTVHDDASTLTPLDVWYGVKLVTWGGAAT